MSVVGSGAALVLDRTGGTSRYIPPALIATNNTMLNRHSHSFMLIIPNKNPLALVFTIEL